MSSKWIYVSTLLALLAGLTAQAKEKKHPRYKLVDLGTFGGPMSKIPPGQKNVNKHGDAAGVASTATPDPTCTNPIDTPTCFLADAFVYRNGAVNDLGTLPGGSYSFGQEINDHGLVGGSSTNGLNDPSTGTPQFHAVVWKKGGKIVDLGTLGGGHESYLVGLNNQGHAVGLAQNLIADPFSMSDVLGIFADKLGTQTRAFLWQNGAMQDLGTLGGPDSVAVVINDRNQVVGWSYTNAEPNAATGIPTIDPFLWEDGAMVDLGTLGGTLGFATSINKRGQISGGSDTAGDAQQHSFFWEAGVMTDLGLLPGGDFTGSIAINDDGVVVGWATTGTECGTGPDCFLHGYSWKKGVMTDLGTIAGDNFSNAQSINSKGQIVGYSFELLDDGSIPAQHAFLYEKGGPMIDLNTLIPASSGLTLIEATKITDRGVIAGMGVRPGVAYEDAETKQQAFLMIPCGDDTQESCADDPSQQEADDDGK